MDERGSKAVAPEWALFFLALRSILRCRIHNRFITQGGIDMVRSLFTLMFACILACSLSTLAVAQDAPAKDKMSKEGRVEGKILRSDKDKSMFTVHTNSGFDKTVVYDDSTKWVSQEHGSKTINTIDVSQVKDGDRVICRGTFDDKGVLHASSISKRLTGAM
jgi:hypothetical protein